MAIKRQLNTREKVILGVTVALFAGVILYKTLLQGFVDEYRSLSDDLETARDRYNESQKLLAGAAKVDKDYDAIAASLTKRQSGKRPDMLFTEEVASQFRRLGVSTPDIKPADNKPVPGIPGFSYLILEVEGITGDLRKMMTVLTDFYKQNVLIQKIDLKAPPANSDDGNLTANVTLAQIVRTEELGIEDEEESPKPGSNASVSRDRSNRRTRNSAEMEEMEEEE